MSLVKIRHYTAETKKKKQNKSDIVVFPRLNNCRLPLKRIEWVFSNVLYCRIIVPRLLLNNRLPNVMLNFNRRNILNVVKSAYYELNKKRIYAIIYERDEKKIRIHRGSRPNK